MSPPDQGAAPDSSPTIAKTPRSAQFPPTPSRTTSKLSIASVDVHLSPQNARPGDGTPHRRKAATGKSRPALPATTLSSASSVSGIPSAGAGSSRNDHGQGTPTKGRHPGAGLLNADPQSPSLRARASTASSKAGSIHDVFLLPATSAPPSSSSTGTTSVSPASEAGAQGIEVVNRGTSSEEIRTGSTGTTGASTPSVSVPTPSTSRKGKERAREGEVTHVQEDEGAHGEMSLSTGDTKNDLRKLMEGSHGVHDGGGPPLLGGEDGERDVGDIVQTKDTKDDPRSTSGEATSYTPRRYYVLTNAGKPVFSTQDDSSEDNITNLMGVAQALISIFAEEDDRIRCIIKGRYRIAFLLKAPLYLFCVSDWGEPEHVLRSHLDYIHLQILSVVSSTQLSRVFQRRSNFDLSRLLEGSETFLKKLIDTAQYDFSYLTSTLQPLRMSPALRDNAAAALMPPSKFKDLLYVLLIAGGHIVTLLRPRKHSIHPSDLHLLLNTLASSTTLRSSETWLPICFPKFNPAGFVHAYVSYVDDDVGLVFVSADRDAFEELRGWKAIVLEKLEADKSLPRIKDAIPLHPYTVAAVGCPGLRHFIYKSRIHVQITQPEWEAPYSEGSTDRKRLITLYQKLHDAVHARSGQAVPLKLVYMKTEHEACLAWFTKPFELYLTVSPQLSKSAVVAAANAVAKWVLAEEGRVFLKDAPVF
ncbi:hypothetical protein IAU60_001510 [Kwoniella sp. DSM 27419]